MRILIAHDVLPDPNLGASGAVYQMSKSLQKLGHKVDNIWADDLPHRIKHGNLHYLLELPTAYVKVIKKRLKEGKNYDVIQISQPHCFLAAKYVRKHLSKTILIHQSHGVELNVERTLKPFIDKERINGRNNIKRIASRILSVLLARHSRLAAKYCDGTLVPSSMDRDFLINELNVSPERIAFIPHGAPALFIESPTKQFTEFRQKKILYVGQFAFIKGPHILARMINTLLEKRPEIIMSWVCNEKHHCKVRELLQPNIQQRVSLLPWMDQEKLISLYDEHGLFIFTSLYEGFGKVFLEAMSRGLCIIASDCGGMQDIINDGENGFLAPIGDIDTFVKITMNLLDNFSLAEKISKKAVITAQKYTWERNAKESVAFYKKLLKLKQNKF